MDGESRESREKRIQELWQKLDTSSAGQIDLTGLKKGLKKLDHPLKNADDLLHDVLKAVDTSGDGRIQFNEFLVFVEHAERELWQLFESIDRDNSGALDKEELRTAFQRAGLTISSSKLDQFFDEVDTNHDGEISFEEWRNFLLFIPAGVPNLRAVLSYYSATASVNQEGDVNINDTLQGFGKLCSPCPPSQSRSSPELSFPFSQGSASPTSPTTFTSTTNQPWSSTVHLRRLQSRLALLPETSDLSSFPATQSYFIAGGLAGMISRTATAPLDRLKVYLIAQTSTKEAAVEAAAKGAPISAIRHFGRPLIDACKDLWAAGGIRSLFAGNGLNVIKVMPESAIKFGAYEAAKRAFARLDGSDPKHLHPTAQFMAGGIGGVVSQCIVYPLDTLKFRMQCETVQGGMRGNTLIKHTAVKMWKQGKIMPFYRGLGMGLAGMFPYSAIDLFIFETSKNLYLASLARRYRCHEEDVHMSNLVTASIGAASGAVSATVVYPVNLLRTRLQAQGTVLHRATYTGIADVTRKTIRNEGWRGLFKGVTPNLLKVAPAVSISYVVYENCKALMDLH
ncbi:uncharacterized protein HMPREF1541_04092 [Cyphellophora europaea CBS 101466]|uniref:Mitochondrial thiamine pyrophosphate carrier 1 n=1 Tax=Cyphellophora europaea (strain CBS 101466) TaxID=1220924 RepID=W2S088_CYPE1|nr:uncharacterized protein HMPREF1541_04092 [Cyphellophora europaea CBS 101466]ETN42151.1 hypothetical protein HMPREF1541_04092 [Cyphellophora europaea CBS 101466]